MVAFTCLRNTLSKVKAKKKKKKQGIKSIYRTYTRVQEQHTDPQDILIHCVPRPLCRVFLSAERLGPGRSARQNNLTGGEEWKHTNCEIYAY